MEEAGSLTDDSYQNDAAKGIAKGIEKGRAKGKEEGIKEGQIIGLEKVAKEMLKENIDILQSIEKSQITIGFKLEDENGINNALQTLHKKSLDAICLNEISSNFTPMDSKENKILWVTKDLQKNLGYADKLHLSFAIFNEAKHL